MVRVVGLERVRTTDMTLRSLMGQLTWTTYCLSTYSLCSIKKFVIKDTYTKLHFSVMTKVFMYKYHDKYLLKLGTSNENKQKIELF